MKKIIEIFIRKFPKQFAKCEHGERQREHCMLFVQLFQVFYYNLLHGKKN